MSVLCGPLLVIIQVWAWVQLWECAIHGTTDLEFFGNNRFLGGLKFGQIIKNTLHYGWRPTDIYLHSGCGQLIDNQFPGNKTRLVLTMLLI